MNRRNYVVTGLQRVVLLTVADAAVSVFEWAARRDQYLVSRDAIRADVETWNMLADHGR